MITDSAAVSRARSKALFIPNARVFHPSCRSLHEVADAKPVNGQNDPDTGTEGLLRDGFLSGAVWGLLGRRAGRLGVYQGVAGWCAAVEHGPAGAAALDEVRVEQDLEVPSYRAEP